MESLRIDKQAQKIWLVTVHSGSRRKNKGETKQTCGEELLRCSLSNFLARSPRLKVSLFKTLILRILCFFYGLNANFAMLLAFCNLVLVNVMFFAKLIEMTKENHNLSINSLLYVYYKTWK